MSREIRCADGLEWLRANPESCSIVTSPPLAHEMGWEMADWRLWYRHALSDCFAALAPAAPAIIYSTDQKHDGYLVSSFELMSLAASDCGFFLLWHKIVLRREPGGIDIHRPGFTHLCAWGDENCRPGKATADVIRRGAAAYPNGMGLIPARLACSFAGPKAKLLVDPFCGRGTVPAVAEALGFDALGLDIDPAQCESARALKLFA